MMQNRLVQFAFTVAIAATFLAVVILGINVFVPHPEFDQERERCWREHSSEPRAVPGGEQLTPEEQARWDEKQKKQEECLDAVREQEKSFVYGVFLIAIPVGAVGVAAGTMLFPQALPLAASGMTLGGLLTILYGMIRGLPFLDQRLAFVAALGALALLLWVARRLTRTR